MRSKDVTVGYIAPLLTCMPRCVWLVSSGECFCILGWENLKCLTGLHLAQLLPYILGPVVVMVLMFRVDIYRVRFNIYETRILVSRDRNNYILWLDRRYFCSLRWFNGNSVVYLAFFILLKRHRRIQLKTDGSKDLLWSTGHFCKIMTYTCS